MRCVPIIASLVAGFAHSIFCDALQNQTALSGCVCGMSSRSKHISVYDNYYWKPVNVCRVRSLAVDISWLLATHSTVRSTYCCSTEYCMIRSSVTYKLHKSCFLPKSSVVLPKWKPFKSKSNNEMHQNTQFKKLSKLSKYFAEGCQDPQLVAQFVPLPPVVLVECVQHSDWQRCSLWTKLRLWFVGSRKTYVLHQCIVRS